MFEGKLRLHKNALTLERDTPDVSCPHTSITTFCFLPGVRVSRVEQQDFSDETELKALYGKTPTFRGAGIVKPEGESTLK